MDSIIIDLLKTQGERLQNIESLLSTSKSVLTIDDVAKLTGLSKSHLYKKTAAKKIKHFKQSRHVYFDRQEIEQWLKSNPVKTAGQIDREATSYIVTNQKGGAQ